MKQITLLWIDFQVITYLNVDFIGKPNHEHLCLREFLNTLTSLGTPPHEL